jgi:hypothetical protein
MGLFNIFRKAKKELRMNNGLRGPTFLEGLTEIIVEPKTLEKHEWRGKLKTASGCTKFQIKYFGHLHPEHQNLIVGIDETPALILAVEPNSGQEIVIFDGCIHGYNAMFCDTYSPEQKKNRNTDKIYRTSDGIDTFELTIFTYNGIDYDDEFGSQVDERGLIELIDGSKVELETVKRNGFDALQILATTENGDVIEIVSEELA